jgi:hypothetical protein
MAELEPGHPDELTHVLKNCLCEAQSSVGSLPDGTDPVKWAVRRFIDYWKGGARSTIEQIEECLYEAMRFCDARAEHDTIKEEIDSARQLLQESLRDHLGLYDWNKEGS